MVIATMASHWRQETVQTSADREAETLVRNVMMMGALWQANNQTQLR